MLTLKRTEPFLFVRGYMAKLLYCNFTELESKIEIKVHKYSVKKHHQNFVDPQKYLVLLMQKLKMHVSKFFKVEKFIVVFLDFICRKIHARLFVLTLSGRFCFL